MKKYSEKITSALTKINEYEVKLADLKGEKHKKMEAQKARLKIERIVDKKRILGEEILEAQHAFIN